MGRVRRFDCLRCGFVAKVAAGRNENHGFSTETLVCRDCKEFYDVVCELEIDPFGLGMDWGFGRHHRIELTPEQVSLIEDKLNLPTSILPASRRIVLQPQGPVRFQKFPRPGIFQIKLACPVHADHRIRNWKKTARCPKCADYLEESLVPFRVWD